jgi:hypothetical protein
MQPKFSAGLGSTIEIMLHASLDAPRGPGDFGSSNLPESSGHLSWDRSDYLNSMVVKSIHHCATRSCSKADIDEIVLDDIRELQS